MWIGRSPGRGDIEAELVMVRAARALASFLEQEEVDASLVRAVARYALFHRVKVGSGESEERVLRRIDAAVDGRVDEGREEGEVVVEPEDAMVPGAAAAGSLMFESLKTKWRGGPRTCNGKCSGSHL